MRKEVSKIIVGIMLVLVIQSNFVFAAPNTTALENQQSENNKKIDEAKSDLEEVQAEKNETIKEVEQISSRITQYEIQIEELNEQISDLNTKISEAEKKLAKAQEDYTKQEKLLNARLVATYEAGDISYLDVILSSKSITDFISNYYLVTELAQNDTELLEKIQKQKQEIEESKKTLEESKKQLDTSKASKQSVSTQLQSAKKEKNAQVAKLSEDEQSIQAKLEELRAANVQISREIKAAQELYAKQIEELNRKKKAAEAAKNNSNNSNNSGNNSASTKTYSSGGSGTLQRPVSGGTITATMYYPSGSYHGAIDYGVPSGTPVYAAADGVVIKTANLTTSYGTYVVIQHAEGLQTWYAHGTSGSILVSPGQIVSRGQQIMSSGNSGHSTGPHLHFEVRVAPYDYSTCRVDPRAYF